MKFPQITITATLLRTLSDIDRHIHELENISLPIHVSRHLDEQNILKSSLYSARIEGNPLSEHELDSENEMAKREVFNLIDAVTYIRALPERQRISIEEICKLHAIVMKGISPDAGRLRKDQNAIFDPSGAVRYVPPPPLKMREDLTMLISEVTTSVEFPLLTALVAHLVFEKIHPFVDGNGRVGRLFIIYLMKSYGESFPLMLPLDRYLEQHRSQYYRVLDIGMISLEEYLIFMTEGIRAELALLLTDARNAQSTPDQLLRLNARQREIYNIIRDHPFTTIDSISRRFQQVSLRIVRYDVSALLRFKLIEKIGSTKGVMYRVRLSPERGVIQ